MNGSQIDYKKILLIVGFALLTVVIGFLLYSLFFKPLPQTNTVGNQVSNELPAGLNISNQTVTPNTEPSGQGNLIIPVSNQTNSTEPTGVNQPTAIPATVVDLTVNPATKPVAASNGGVQYYNQTDGKFYRIDPSGRAVALSDQKFYNVTNVVWSPDKNQAVLEYPDASKIVYNFATQKQASLPSHWQEFSWSPDSSQLAFKTMPLDVDSRYLTIAGANGANLTKVEKIGANADNVYTSWSPSGQTVALDVEGSDFNNNEIYFIGLHNENFKSTVIPGRGLQYRWSPSGDRLLYSVYSATTNYQPSLWLVDAQGDSIGNNRQPLNIPTFADKCVFATSQTAYCAVPTSLPEGSGMMPSITKTIPDNLYKIDLTSGAKTQINLPTNQDYSLFNLSISSDQRYLYFTDNATNKLHRITLK